MSEKLSREEKRRILNEGKNKTVSTVFETKRGLSFHQRNEVMQRVREYVAAHSGCTAREVASVICLDMGLKDINQALILGSIVSTFLSMSSTRSTSDATREFISSNRVEYEINPLFRRR